ncbi:hypothetical protein [Campylobacter californiensis]|uniref:hypothetical protein n=1 Tax=Campylobacter californiensis TaxID=1032243 RepID=UPI00147680E2|nr:hypothetical protein [Campylobacter sp. RM12916]MBE3610523.1 hypothetical protein [Campylobacter sp. RM12916]
MLISSKFNRFIHGVILSEIRRLRYLAFKEHRIAIRPFYLTDETLKQLLKRLDFDYPREKNGEPLSYTKLRETDFLSHIAFLETIMAQNGYEPKYLDELKKEKQCLTK